MFSYIFGLYFVLLPLVVIRASHDPFEYPKVLFFVISINLLLTIKIWVERNRLIKLVNLNFVDKLLIILLTLQIFTWIINGFSPITFWGQYYRYEGIVTLLGYLSFYFLISRFGKLEIIQKIISFGNLLFGIYVLVSGVLFTFFKFPVYTFNGRAAGTFGNPNFAAGFLTLSLPYLLFNEKIGKIYKIIGVLITMSALFFTQSRSGLLGFFIILFLFLRRKSKYNLFLILPILITLSILLFNLIPRYSPSVNQFKIWEKAVTAIQKKPLGYGLERFEVAFKKTLIPNKDFDLYNVRVDKAHNEILEQGVSGGILTMIIYIWILVAVFLHLKKFKNNPYFEANYLAFIGFLIISQLNVLNINEYLFFYFILASVYKNKNL